MAAHMGQGPDRWRRMQAGWLGALGRSQAGPRGATGQWGGWTRRALVVLFLKQGIEQFELAAARSRGVHGAAAERRRAWAWSGDGRVGAGAPVA